MPRSFPLALAAAALLLSGCSASGDSSPRSAASDPASVPSGSALAAAGGAGPADLDVTRYVALGDSFSAGPLIPTTHLAGGCARSDHNYPSLVAHRLDVRDFVDVTCSGATTEDLSQSSHPFEDATVPPQLESVTADTDLVTIGIGGNDLHLFSTLVGTCTRLASSDPHGAPCTRALRANGPDLHSATTTISDRVATALREIRKRAPRARVLLVGYLRLVPDHGTCPALPLADGDYPAGRRISLVLDHALSSAAKQTEVDFVDAYALSRGHDVCSAKPWVNGRVTRRDRALAYHPLASGMHAVADRVVHVLDQPQ